MCQLSTGGKKDRVAEVVHRHQVHKPAHVTFGTTKGYYGAGGAERERKLDAYRSVGGGGRAGGWSALLGRGLAFRQRNAALVVKIRPLDARAAKLLVAGLELVVAL